MGTWQVHPTRMQLVRRKCVELLWIIAIALVLLEIALQPAVRLGYINLSLPSYSGEAVTPFWQDINADFGVWHPANARYRHRKSSCIDIVYTSNSHGMRHRETPLSTPARRVVMLGDS